MGRGMKQGPSSPIIYYFACSRGGIFILPYPGQCPLGCFHQILEGRGSTLLATPTSTTFKDPFVPTGESYSTMTLLKMHLITPNFHNGSVGNGINGILDFLSTSLDLVYQV